MKHVLTCLLLLCSFGAAAQVPQSPKSLSDCERIKNDLAYNQCLASFGPKRGERAVGGPSDDDGGPAARRPRRSGRFVQRSRGGRQAAAFDVVSKRRGSRSRR